MKDPKPPKIKQKPRPKAHDKLGRPREGREPPDPDTGIIRVPTGGGFWIIRK